MSLRPLSFNAGTVLITGASSGLGEEMARQLAQHHGVNLILVARRAERLNELQQQLTAYGIRCDTIVADLSKPDDVERVYSETLRLGGVQGVILNAGITYFGRHETLSWEGFEALLATNVTSTIRLMHLFVPYLIQQGQLGSVMVVSSLGSLVPVPFQAAYAASKAFVTQFALSWALELDDQPVSITVFAPGGIDTEMSHETGLAQQFENSLLLQSVQDCASEALDAMSSRQFLAVPGWLNRTQLLLSRLVPRRWVGKITLSAYKKALRS